MTNSERDDLFYVCSLIEYIGRKTNNHRGMIVEKLGIEGIEKQMHDAGVNHCLSFEQVSDEVIEQYHIEQGDFDTISQCQYPVPGTIPIGKLYARLVFACAKPGKEIEELWNVFQSYLSDEISDFKTGVYYQNPGYLEASYQSGYLLD